MKSSAQLGCSAGHSNPAADFIAGDDRSQKTLAVNVPSMTHEGIGRRYRFGAGVDEADSMKVVHLEAMDQRAVRQRRAGAWNLRAVAPDQSTLSFSHFF